MVVLLQPGPVWQLQDLPFLSQLSLSGYPLPSLSLGFHKASGAARGLTVILRRAGGFHPLLSPCWRTWTSITWEYQKVPGWGHSENKVFFFLTTAAAVSVFIYLVGCAIMGNAEGSMEVPPAKEGKAASAPPGPTGPQKQPAALRLPMPPEEELEERFSAVLVSCDVQVNFYTEGSSNAKRRRMWNMLESCRSSGRAYRGARYTKPLWKDT